MFYSVVVEVVVPTAAAAATKHYRKRNGTELLNPEKAKYEIQYPTQKSPHILWILISTCLSATCLQSLLGVQHSSNRLKRNVILEFISSFAHGSIFRDTDWQVVLVSTHSSTLIAILLSSCQHVSNFILGPIN